MLRTHLELTVEPCSGFKCRDIGGIGRLVRGAIDPAQRIVDQSEFTTRLDNILQEGVGNLIDADLGAEAAGLAAGRVKEELGARSLAIANAGPKALLSLFPGGS